MALPLNDLQKECLNGFGPSPQLLAHLALVCQAPATRQAEAGRWNSVERPLRAVAIVTSLLALNPKSEGRRPNLSVGDRSGAFSGFGLRPSFGSRPSGFGFQPQKGAESC